jgi:hypothetical protein
MARVLPTLVAGLIVSLSLAGAVRGQPPAPEPAQEEQRLLLSRRHHLQEALQKLLVDLRTLEEKRDQRRSAAASLLAELEAMRVKVQANLADLEGAKLKAQADAERTQAVLALETQQRQHDIAELRRELSRLDAQPRFPKEGAARTTEAPNVRKATTALAPADKLDRILERLERIEHRLDRLEKSTLARPRTVPQ